jgi:anthranilate synthase component 1
VEADDPFEDLDRRLRVRQPVRVRGLPRFWGGAVGFFGYEVIRYIERLPDAPPDDLDLPDGFLLFTDLVLVIDNPLGRAMVVAAVPVESGLSGTQLRNRCEKGGRRAQDMIQDLEDRPRLSPLELRPEPGKRSALHEHHDSRCLRGGRGADPRVHPGG